MNEDHSQCDVCEGLLPTQKRCELNSQLDEHQSAISRVLFAEGVNVDAETLTSAYHGFSFVCQLARDYVWREDCDEVKTDD